MIISEKIKAIRATRWQEPSLSWGLVPTMGALHQGHISLVRQARAENERVGVSIFVNPTQFNNTSDLQNYPRDVNRDLALLKAEGVDLVWTPSPAEVYPPDFQTHIRVENVTQPLEGAKRPGHFKGVTTVVGKLFNVFQPQRAYFGQKDAQQVAVIKQMVRDLNFNLDIVVCPTLRENDGLAMSSRNALLSPSARVQATCLSQALSKAQIAFSQGEHQATALRQIMTKEIEKAPLAQIDYVSVAHPQSLQELDDIGPAGALLSLAVFVDTVRLIDNMMLEN